MRGGSFHRPLSRLYDSDVMPIRPRKAHRALDEAVDKLYRSGAFAGDRERVEQLFGLYELGVARMVAAAQSGPKARKRT